MANDLLSGKVVFKVDQHTRSYADAACNARVISRTEVSDSVRSFEGNVVDVEEEIPQFCVAHDPTYTRCCGKVVHLGCSFCYEHLMAMDGDDDAHSS